MLKCAALLCSCLVFAGGDDKKTSKDDPQKAELAKLAGKWTLTRIQSAEGNTPIPEDSGNVVFTDSKYKFTLQDMEEAGKMNFMPDKNPKWVNVKIEVGNDAGKEQFGIYELQGDTLKMCFAYAGEPDSDRPKSLIPKPGTRETLFVFKRAAAASKDGSKNDKKNEKKEEKKDDKAKTTII